MPRQQRIFARKISGKHYRILAYRDPTSGRWRQKSQGSVTPQEAWQINEDWRLQQKADDLPTEPQELVAAYLEAVGDLGLVLGAIGNRLPEDAQAGYAVAVAAFDRGHGQVVELVADDEDEHLFGQVGRAVGLTMASSKETNKEEGLAANQESVAEAGGSTDLPGTKTTWDAVHDLVDGFNQMSQGLDALAEIANDGYAPVKKMQGLAEDICCEMSELRGFIDTGDEQ